MKIAALGDAHLGRSYLSVTAADGINQREKDFEDSFRAAVDLALAQEPDLIIWLGDIFDHPRPTFRSYRVAQTALAKIRAAGVRAVVISGNHDTPRLTGTGSPYTALSDAFERDHLFATRMTYERFELPGLVIHAVPQMMAVEHTLEALAQADRERSLDATNLLLTHPRITSVEPKYADINEIQVDDSTLQSDLVLLGHYHFHTQVREGMWYAGSTDSFTFADDPDKAKGIVVLDTDTGACQHIPIPGQRPLVTLPTLAALGLSPTEVQTALAERAAMVPEGAVARIYIEGVDPQAYRLVDLDAVRHASAGLHLSFHADYAGTKSNVELPDLDAIGGQWDRYLEGQDLTGYDRDRMKTLGNKYLSDAIEAALQ